MNMIKQLSDIMITHSATISPISSDTAEKIKSLSTFGISPGAP